MNLLTHIVGLALVGDQVSSFCNELEEFRCENKLVVVSLVGFLVGIQPCKKDSRRIQDVDGGHEFENSSDSLVLKV